MATLLDKVELVNSLAGDKRLTDAQFRAAVTLLLKFHNTGSGACHPSLRQWSEASCLGRSTVSEAATKLRAIGAISYETSSGGRNKRNAYRLNVRLGEQKRSPARTALNPVKYINRGFRKRAGGGGLSSQPQFKPEKPLNIPPPEARAAQVARLVGRVAL